MLQDRIQNSAEPASSGCHALYLMNSGDIEVRTTEATEFDKSENSPGYLYEDLIAIGAEFYSRGWLYGTSGNLSKVINREPLRLAITSSGFDKGKLESSQVLEIGENLEVLAGKYRPSSESALHVTVISKLGAGAVFHTHSTWSTVLSELNSKHGGISISGYEMLKGLQGVKSHEHEEWIPILENSQDMQGLSRELATILDRYPDIHGFLLKGHGLYTWGKSVKEAKRHVEVIEFLLEVKGRTGGIPQQ